MTIELSVRVFVWVVPTKKARNITAYRSDLNGTVVAATDGSQITITTEKG